MITTNSQIRQKALTSLKGRWGASIATFLIFSAVSGVIAAVPFINIFSSLLTIPLSYGFTIWFLNLIRSKDGYPDIADITDGFNDYSRVFITMFLVNFYIFLWSLLLIVPGIIKAMSYALTAFILEDNPELKNNEAIELSMNMMRGRKMQLFLMVLNFAMWSILSLFTLCIGLFWVIPYAHTTLATFYEEVKSDYQANEIAVEIE